MENTRLISLLQTLDKKEWRELRKFVRSPFINQREDVLRLFNIFGDCIKNAKPIPEKPALFKKIYPKEEFEDHKIRMIMSFLFRYVEQFLVYKEIFGKEVKVKTQLAQIYRRRNLSKHFERTLKEAKVLNNKYEGQDEEYYENAFLLFKEEVEYNGQISRVSDLNIEMISDNLDITFILRKLRQALSSLMHQTMFKKEYHLGLLPEVLEYVEKENLQKIPIVAAYYYCYLALTNFEKPEYFESFKKIILEKSDIFSTDDARDFFVLAISYCIKKYNTGSTEFLNAQFELYKTGLKKDYFLTDGFLSRYTYQNIVIFGLVKEEFEWVNDFIHEYKDYLKPKFRESVFSINLALLCYEQKLYDKALGLLQISDYKDLILTLNAKTLILKIYYELDEFDALISHLDAMRIFIRRKRDLGYHREIYLNTIKYTKKLVEVNPFDKKAKTALKAEIETVNPIAEKSWLLEQVNLL